MDTHAGNAGNAGHVDADVATAVANLAAASPVATSLVARNLVVKDPADHAEGTARRPGRPRSERAEQAILDATIEAVGDCGIDGVRCEDVAARAGVGKATLYRRWPGKEDLLIAAFAALKSPLPEPRGDSVREDLIAMLEVMVADSDDPRYAQQYALLHGEGQRYPRLMARYKAVSYTHLRAHETRHDLVCRLLLEKK